MADLWHNSVSVVIPVKDEHPAFLGRLTFEMQRAGLQTIVVDDGSTPSCALADVRHDTSQGYGAALKSGIRTARTPWIVTMDGDGQHTLADVQRLIEFVTYFPHLAMVIGDRRLHERGLRLWGRKMLNWTATLFTGRWIPDLNSGLRIFRRDLALAYEPILCDQFSYTTSFTLSLLTDGYAVDWLPIKVAPRNHGQSKVHVLVDGWRTLKYIVVIGLALNTRTIRRWIRPFTRLVLCR